MASNRYQLTPFSSPSDGGSRRAPSRTLKSHVAALADNHVRARRVIENVWWHWECGRERIAFNSKISIRVEWRTYRRLPNIRPAWKEKLWKSFPKMSKEKLSPDSSSDRCWSGTCTFDRRNLKLQSQLKHFTHHPLSDSFTSLILRTQARFSTSDTVMRWFFVIICCN